MNNKQQQNSQGGPPVPPGDGRPPPQGMQLKDDNNQNEELANCPEYVRNDPQHQPGYLHPDMPQVPAIDKFNQAVINRVIAELQKQNENNEQRDVGSANFGYQDSGDFGYPKNFGGLQDGQNEDTSLNETLNQLKGLWERHFKHSCQEAMENARLRNNELRHQDALKMQSPNPGALAGPQGMAYQGNQNPMYQGQNFPRQGVNPGRDGQPSHMPPQFGGANQPHGAPPVLPPPVGGRYGGPPGPPGVGPGGRPGQPPMSNYFSSPYGVPSQMGPGGMANGPPVPGAPGGPNQGKAGNEAAGGQGLTGPGGPLPPPPGPVPTGDNKPGASGALKTDTTTVVKQNSSQQSDEGAAKQQELDTPVLGKRTQNPNKQDKPGNAKKQKTDGDSENSDEDDDIFANKPNLVQTNENGPKGDKEKTGAQGQRRQDENASEESDDELDQAFNKVPIKTDQDDSNVADSNRINNNGQGQDQQLNLNNGNQPTNDPRTGQNQQPEDEQESDQSAVDSDDNGDEQEENKNGNVIVAQYKTENRVKSIFKFNLQNVVMFIDGLHYFVKELKASIQF